MEMQRAKPVEDQDTTEVNEVDAYLLALLASDRGAPIPGKLHLQKEMYLLQRAVPTLGEQLDFEPYFLGPHSLMVEDEADELERSGYLTYKAGIGYSLAARGAQLVPKVLQSLPKRHAERVEEFKHLLNDLTNDELLAFIYFGYPSSEVERESAEYRSLLPRREELARSLFNKKKVSAERAAEIAGVSLEDFIDSIE